MMMRVGRPIVPANVRPDNVLNKDKIQLDLEENHREDDTLFVQPDNKNLKDHLFSTYIGKWKEKLNGVRKSQNVSVRYVTRKDVVPPPIADDPATNYNSHDEELFSRNRIVREGQEERAVEELENGKKQWWTPQAILDNNTVFDKGEMCFSKTRYWAHIGKTIQTVMGVPCLPPLNWTCWGLVPWTPGSALTNGPWRV